MNRVCNEVEKPLPWIVSSRIISEPLSSLTNNQYFYNVGLTIKNLRVFFNYLNKELVLGVGDFHKSFYVRKEEIPIFPLLPEELNFLINDKIFEASLSKRMQEAKDFFVFGCTVALRVSDLFNLRSSNIRVINAQHYLAVRSVKTKTDTMIKLPSFAVDIITKQGSTDNYPEGYFGCTIGLSQTCFHFFR